MKKIILLLIMVVIPLISASCTTNNDFTVGDEINICTDNCTYQNSSNLSHYIDCDDTIEGRLTAFYPNNSLIITYKSMSRNGNIYNYTLGSLTTTGTYTGRFFFFGEKGWTKKDFTFSVSETSGDDGGGGGGGGISGSTPSSESEVDLREPLEPKEVKSRIDKTLEVIKGTFSAVGSYASPKYPWMGLIIIVVVILIIYVISVRNKEKILKKIEK